MITCNGNDSHSFASLVLRAEEILVAHGLNMDDDDEKIVRGENTRGTIFAKDVMGIAHQMTEKIVSDAATAYHPMISRWNANSVVTEWYQAVPGLSAAQGVSASSIAVCSCSFLEFEPRVRVVRGVGNPKPGSSPFGTVEIWCPDLWKRHLYPVRADTERGTTGILIVDALSIVCHLVRAMPEDLTFLLSEYADYELDMEAEFADEEQ